MPALLLTQAVPTAIETRLRALYDIHRLDLATDPDAFLAEVGPCIRGVVTGGAKGCAKALMDQLPRLEIIAVAGVGTDAVDLAEARRRGIRIATTPGVLTDDVADMAMGLLLMSLRDLGLGERLVRSGQWGQVTQPLARKVTGIRLGIVGLGQVGRAIARRAKAFDMHIGYTDLHPQPELGYRHEPNLLALAQDSDVLILAASADHGQVLITAEVLEALGPQGYFINVARGKLVDEPALVVALQERRIAGAGLDVFADEPHVPTGLLKLDNVVLQPHRASATEQTRLAMGEIVLAHLEDCFAVERAAS